MSNSFRKCFFFDEESSQYLIDPYIAEKTLFKVKNHHIFSELLGTDFLNNAMNWIADQKSTNEVSFEERLASFCNQSRR